MAYRKTAYTRRKSAASRKALLEAALRLFLVRGFHPTSMQQIVSEAGTSIGNAYFYFSNKADLCAGLVDVIDGNRGAAVERLNPVRAGDSGLLDFHLLCLSCLALARLGAAADDRVLIEALISAGCRRQQRFLLEHGSGEMQGDPLSAHVWTGALRGVMHAATGELARSSTEALATSLGQWRLKSLQRENGDEVLGRALEAAAALPAWSRCLRHAPRTMAGLPRLLEPLPE